MKEYRVLTPEEIVSLEAAGNSADDWSGVSVSEDFNVRQLRCSRFGGRVRIGSGVRIANSFISDYSVGDRTEICSVTAVECRHRSRFGNGTQVACVNGNGGRSVRIFNGLTAQFAYFMAMYRHRPRLTESLDRLASRCAEEVEADMGRIGCDCRLNGAKFIREVNIGDRVVVDGASLLENGTLLDGARAGVDVKAKDFIAAENSVIDLGAICERCFVGESVIISKGFSAENSLFFANSYCENGEAAEIFAGPYTVSHHKSSLLIAGIFSFFNAGSGTNQSNHLFKGGAVHQSVHRRGCKFASNGYVMAPAAEGAYTVVLGRHNHHHDTTDMPFSYLIESGGVSMLMPALNLRSYGTVRDIEKWSARDMRTVRRDNINFEEYNPYVTGKVIKALSILRRLHDANPDESLYHYNNTTIKATMLQFAIKHYDNYIVAALGAMLSAEVCADEGDGEWVDAAGQYLPKSTVCRLADAIESGRIESAGQVCDYLRERADRYTASAKGWALARLAERVGHTPTKEDIAECMEAGRCAHATLRKMAMADLEKENSAEMSVGYGTDCDDEAEVMADFNAVRGL